MTTYPKLRCKSCGAHAEASCDCGVGYIPAGKYAALLVNSKDSQKKSNRQLAKETGVNERTVRRARKTLPATPAANAAPDAPTKLNVLQAMKNDPKKSNRAIAKETGVSEATVRRTRDQVDVADGTANIDIAEFVAQNVELTNTALARRLKVKEDVIRRARKALTKGKDQKQDRPARPRLVSVNTGQTPEEIGWPSEDRINKPHPDYPGYTYGQRFIFDHGHVHLMPVKEREIMRKQITLMEFSVAVRDLGRAARDFAKVKPLDVVEYQQILATMEDQQGKQRLRWLTTHYDDLKKAWQLIEPFGVLIKERKEKLNS